jgi:hypothetical protein
MTLSFDTIDENLKQLPKDIVKYIYLFYDLQCKKCELYDLTNCPKCEGFTCPNEFCSSRNKICSHCNMCIHKVNYYYGYGETFISICNCHPQVLLCVKCYYMHS